MTPLTNLFKKSIDQVRRFAALKEKDPETYKELVNCVEIHGILGGLFIAYTILLILRYYDLFN